MGFVEITAARPDDAAAPSLLAALDVDLAQRYDSTAEEEAMPLDPLAVAPPWGGFFLASVDGEAAGCVALRHLEPSVGELVRLYVTPPARGQGVGRALVAAVEDAGRSLRYRTLRLETGLRQPEAIRLYESMGYRQIPRYGRYADSPLSVCFRKALR